MRDQRQTTFDVKIWKTEVYEGKKVTTYSVRWKVAERPAPFRQGFRTAAAAESFRSKLVTALREGQAFDVETGRPLSMLRRQKSRVGWYDFACRYVDMKWSGASPKHRKSIAEALITVTPTMLDTSLDAADAKAIRSALLNWGFNARRGSDAQPDQVTERLAWVARHSRPVSDLARPETIRATLNAIATKLDGTRAAGRTATVKRANFSNALSYAVELGLLDTNPVLSVKWTAPRSVTAVDRRSVANPDQARALLRAVDGLVRSGPRLVAFFGCLYYSALRPEEAVNVRKSWLDLPEEGWGWIILERAAPEAGSQWTDSGTPRDERELKHRAVGETRRVPSPPALTALFHGHLTRFGTDADGRLFCGERGGPLAGVTYTRLWDRARKVALTPEQYASLLVRRPYDLRHAAVSTWLNGGVAPTQVAEWAGHSVEVLLKIYAKCLDGHEHIALRRIDEALNADQLEKPAVDAEPSKEPEDWPDEGEGKPEETI
jgi:integrase